MSTEILGMSVVAAEGIPEGALVCLNGSGEAVTLTGFHTTQDSEPQEFDPGEVTVSHTGGYTGGHDYTYVHPYKTTPAPIFPGTLQWPQSGQTITVSQGSSTQTASTYQTYVIKHHGITYVLESYLPVVIGARECADCGHALAKMDYATGDRHEFIEGFVTGYSNDMFFTEETTLVMEKLCCEECELIHVFKYVPGCL